MIGIIGEFLMLVGAVVALLAATGLVKFNTPYARFHAAGKASPIAFMITAAGAALNMDLEGSALLLIATLAMLFTLPVGVHLVFRAVHSTGERPEIDELAEAQAKTPGPKL